MNKMNVTARDVKVALTAAGFDLDQFHGYAWNDKRKNGRRIKMPFSRSFQDQDISSKLIIAQNLLTMMFPTDQIELKEIENGEGRPSSCKYKALAVYVTRKF